MQTIDVHDLPEPIARAIAETVEALRQQLSKKNGQPKRPVPAWRLGAKGSLSRAEIYDHLDERQ